MPEEGNYHETGRKIVFQELPFKGALFLLACLFFGIDRTMPHVLQVKLVEVRKTAIPATDSEVVTADEHIVRPCDPAVAATGRDHHLPGIITPERSIASLAGDCLHPGYKDAGCATVLTHDLCPVGHRLDNLLCFLSAMVTGGPVPGEDEPVDHK
jgi:hypothetical protein